MQEVYKWKACLHVHGGQQEYGVNYWETYTPMVTWETVCFCMILSLIHKLDTLFTIETAYLQNPHPLYLAHCHHQRRRDSTPKR